MTAFISLPAGARPRGRADVVEAGRPTRPSRSGSGSCSTRGCRARRGASTRSARRARPATTHVLALPRRRTSRRASTPATRPTPPAASPSSCRPTVDGDPRARRRPRRGRRARRPVLRLAPRRHPQPAAGRRAGARLRRRRARHARPPRSCGRCTPTSRSPPSPGGRQQAGSRSELGATDVRARAARGSSSRRWPTGRAAAAPAVGRPADRCTRRRRRRLRHRRRAGDARGRRCGCCGARRHRSCSWAVSRRPASSGRPWYFKELRLHRSNAFGVEEVDGVRQHAIAHYLDLAASGRIDLRRAHPHLPARRWRDAFGALVDQGAAGALKVAFDFR